MATQSFTDLKSIMGSSLDPLEITPLGSGSGIDHPYKTSEKNSVQQRLP